MSIVTLIEEASSGVQAIQQIKKSHSHVRIVPVKPTQDKITRLMGISSYIENGTCLFPNQAGHWWKEFEAELLTFPNSTFKDQCDALSQGIEYGATRLSYPPQRELVVSFSY